MSRGKLIVIEGLDRAGKSTQCDLLLDRLQEQGPAELLKFPDRSTGIGKMIDQYLASGLGLSDESIHLLFSANRWELATTLREKLKKGTSLVIDRYVYSGIAFTAAKGLDVTWCKNPDVGLPAADLVLFLDVSPDVARSRGGYGEERYEKEEFQKRVRDLFKQLQSPDWKWINADGTADEVAAEVWSAVSELSVPAEIPVFR